MTTELPERFDLATESTADGRLAALRELFPDVMRENKIDVEALRRSLGDWVDPGPERFGLTWPGKAECMRVIQEPSIGTLVPRPDESVDWDTTQNVIIEGENLEVLKLLQKAYYGKVKLIYIDPPYNTGKEFIYPDNFKEGLADYLRYSGQIDEEGFKLSANAETDGRYHSKWLSMIYPRLFLARNLLSEGGVIFVSIDDHEMHNLRAVMNEIFGEENFLGCVTVISNLKGRSDDRYFATAHNYLLAFQRGAFQPRGVPLPDSYFDDYPETDANGRAYRLQGLRKRGSNARREDRPSMFYPFYADPATGEVALAPSESKEAKILPVLSDGSDGRWRWGRATATTRLEELRARQVGPDKRWDVFQIDWADRDGAEKRVTPKTVWMGSEFANETGTLEVKSLLGKGVFDNPKPTGLIRQILEYSVGPDDLVLDFFAGSGTVGQAVLEANEEDAGRRQFVLIQLPEEMSAQGYTSIAEVTRARVERAAAVVSESLLAEGGDNGFRAFRLTASNFTVWNASPDSDCDTQLTISVDHVKAGATEDAMFTELLLKAGFPLTSPVEQVTFAGVPGYSVSDGALLVCLSDALTIEAFEAMVATEPAMILVLDAGFGGSDELKVNALQTVRARNQQSGSDIALRVV